MKLQGNDKAPFLQNVLIIKIIRPRSNMSGRKNGLEYEWCRIDTGLEAVALLLFLENKRSKLEIQQGILTGKHVWYYP